MQSLAAGGLAEARPGRALSAARRISLAASMTSSKLDVRAQDRDRTPAGPALRAASGAQFHGCSSSAADLRHRGQPFDPVDLQIGLAVAGNLHQFEQVRGARHRMALEELLAADAVGRADDRAGPSLQMCRSSSRRRPRNSRARSSFVTGSPSPASGHNALSGLEITTPITSADLPSPIASRAALAALAAALAPPSASRFGELGHRRGHLRLAPRRPACPARSPLNAACRTLPSSVQPANSISATSSGFSQCTSRRFFGASLPPNGLFGGRRLQRRHACA